MTFKRSVLLSIIASVSIFISVQWAAGEPLTVYYFERPPYYFTEQTRATGFLVELAREILDDAGIESSFAVMPPKRILAEIEDNRHVACSVGWFKTPEREKFARFTLPVYRDRPIAVLITRLDKARFENLTTLEELFSDRSLKLGVISSFSYGDYIDKLIEDFSPETERVTADQSHLIKMLYAGRIKYMLIAPEEMEALVNSANLSMDLFDTVSLSGLPSGNIRYIMCSRCVDQDLIRRINLSIKKRVDFGSFK